MSQKIFIISFMMGIISSFLYGQTNGFETVQYRLYSGVYTANSMSETQNVFESTVELQNTILIRLAFSDFYLGNNSYIKVFLEEDQTEFDLFQNTIEYFNSTSPYFKGDKITLTLFQHPEDDGVFFNVDSVLIFNPASCVTTGICGDDSRIADTTPFNKAMVGYSALVQPGLLQHIKSLQHIMFMCQNQCQVGDTYLNLMFLLLLMESHK
jgi:hypothetical protein